MSPLSGKMGDTITVTPMSDSIGDWRITLRRGAGPTFSYERFEPSIDWSVQFYSWSDSTSLFSTPLSTSSLTRLDFMWYRPPKTFAFLPQERWSLRATGSVALGTGTYTLRTISDDAVRVWVDDSLVIDQWVPHESLVETTTLQGGTHRLAVEYFQKDGWVELRVEIVRGSDLEKGSPGPH